MLVKNLKNLLYAFSNNCHDKLKYIYYMPKIGQTRKFNINAAKDPRLYLRGR